MNIAFSSVLLLLAFLPGIIFSVAFFNTDHKPIQYVPLTHKAIAGIFATFALHALWLELSKILSSYPFSLNFTINIHTLLILASGATNSDYINAINSITTNNCTLFISYTLSIYVFAFISAKLLRQFITWTKLDKKYELFRLETKWHYLFGGHDWEEGDPEGVLVAATHELGGKGYLYLGVLKSFHLDNEGNLDYIILTSVLRREISLDKGQHGKNKISERFYPVDGDFLILKYKEIKTLNIQYLKIEDA